MMLAGPAGRCATMDCQQHPGIGAVAACERCGKSLCAICATSAGEKTVCRDCADVLRREPPAKEEAPAADPAPEEPIPGAAPAPQLPEPGPTESLVPAPQREALAQPRPTATGAGGARSKESLLSAVLSLLVPGVGQAYNGETKKGIVLFLLYLAAFAVAIGITVMFAFVSGYAGTCCCLPAFVLPLAVLVYAIFDAYETAEKINDGEQPRDWL